MELLITARANNKQKRIGWVSLQPDGSVSVGLSDSTFVSPDFKAQNFVWSADHRRTIHYLISSDSRTLRPIRNPHLSFHPPHDFHLHANGGNMLFEGIADLDLMLRQDGIVPWIRFVSRAVGRLADAGLTRNPGRARVVLIDAPSEDCSVGFGVDFAAQEQSSRPSDVLVSEWVQWRTYWLHLHGVALPPQVATLSWFHQR